MAIRTKTFSIIGFVTGIICLISLIVAFASDRWVVSTETQITGFKNLGLWSTCFSKYRPPPWALVDKYYDGCWWVLDREMDDLRFFLFPTWFVGTQVLVTLSLIFQLVAVVVMTVNAINCFPYSRLKDVIALALSATAAVMHGSTALLLTVAVIMFGARADNERTWLQNPDQNYLSWSFGACVLAAFLAIIAFMSVCTEFYRLWLKRRNKEEPDMAFTTIPPLKTGYMYNEKAPLPPSPYSTRVSQPANLSRYPNHGSQPSLNLKASNTNAEIYVNHLNEFDENRQRGRLTGYVSTYERGQVHPETRPGRGRDFVDGADSRRIQLEGSTGGETTTDYEESKKITHPVLPEYIPKLKNTKKVMESTLDESFTSQLSDDASSDNEQPKSRSKSENKGKKSDKSRSDSEKRKRKKRADTDADKRSDSGQRKRRSKKKTSKNVSSDDEGSRSRQRSKKSSSSGTKRKSSRSRDRSSSRHRSHSRDLNSSYSDVESESASVASRSRKKNKHKKESSQKSGKKDSSSVERSRKDKSKRSSSSQLKKKLEAGYAEDYSGSEYSSKQKSKRKGDSTGMRKSKSLDFSDAESTRSKQSKQGGRKSKHSYSSYYEY